MSINDITLTSSMRSNLLSLKNTSALLDRTQERLSTGKKVNSALDNPSSYFTAQSLNARAGDLNNLLDSMGQAVQTIKAADEGITTLTSLVEQAKSIADQAFSASKEASEAKGTADDGKYGSGGKIVFTVTVPGEADTTEVSVDATGDAAAVAAAINENDDAKAVGMQASVVEGKLVVSNKNGYAFETAETAGTDGTEFGVATTAEAKNSLETYQTNFNNILTQINEIVQDTSYKGINLLNGDDLTVNFNETRTSTLKIEGVTFDAAGLGLTTAADWNNAEKLDASISAAETAINTLREQASTFGQNLSVVQTRQDFTESMINILTSGADALTLADMNEEAANMLALQTRQSLGTNALSMAAQAEQSVLQLF